MREEKMYGWFSGQAAESSRKSSNNEMGFCVYLDTDGKEVMVTNVTQQKETQTHWKDEQFVGELIRCVRDNTGAKQYRDE